MPRKRFWILMHPNIAVGERASRRGGMIVLIAVCLPIFLTMAAFALNIAYIDLTRAELRTATDFAARSGGRTLSATGSKAAATTAAKDTAARHMVGGAPLLLADADIQFGVSTRTSEASKYVYTSGSPKPNSVYVLGDLSAGSLSGPRSLPFDSVFSLSQFGAQQVSIATVVDRDIAIVMDRSGSMAFAVNEPSGGTPQSAPPGWDWCDAVPPSSRWEDTVAGVLAFLVELQDTPQLELVSLVVFDSSSITEVNLTSDYTQITNAMDATTQSFCGGNTAIGDGLQDAISAVTHPNFGRSWVAKTIVVLTDGINTAGADPLVVVNSATAAGITVHTITYSDEANQTQMQQLAADGNGQHWHAPTGAVLQNAFVEIAENNPTLLTE